MRRAHLEGSRRAQQLAFSRTVIGVATAACSSVCLAQLVGRCELWTSHHLALTQQGMKGVNIRTLLPCRYGRRDRASLDVLREHRLRLDDQWRGWVRSRPIGAGALGREVEDDCVIATQGDPIPHPGVHQGDIEWRQRRCARDDPSETAVGGRIGGHLRSQQRREKSPV
jgi:hypothetical protein